MSDNTISYTESPFVCDIAGDNAKPVALQNFSP